MEGISFGDIIVSLIISIINMLIMFWVVRALVYKPVKSYMQSRTVSIDERIKRAEVMQAQAQVLKEQSEEVLKNADEIAEDKKREAMVAADAVSKQTIAEANKRAGQLLEEAGNRIEAERQKSIELMREQIGGYAVDIAEKIIEREVSLKQNQDIIDKFFDKVG